MEISLTRGRLDNQRCRAMPNEFVNGGMAKTIVSEMQACSMHV
jgi:hypothetical protein